MADNTTENTVSKRLVDLRVVDLKLELEKRSLEKTGVKQALLERLKKALLDEGQDPESCTFQVSTPNSVKVPKKAESFQENVPSCEDIGSDTSELISIGYETDEKDLSLDICHVIDEDIPETEEASSQPDGDSERNKEDKCDCDPNVSDEDLSFQDDDPVKLCIDESPLKMSEGITRCLSPEPVQKDESHNRSPELQPTFLDEQTQSSKPDENITESFEIETNDLMPSNELHLSPSLSQQSEEKNSDSEKKNEEIKNEDDKESDKGNATVEIQTTKTKELQPIDEGTSKDQLGTNKDDRSPKNQPKNTTKSSEARSETDSNLTKNEKSSNQASKSRENEPKTSGHNLWVSGLSSSTRATDLKNLFSKYGKVTGAKVVTNAKSPGSKCYGFVTMTSSDEASKCIQHLHRTELHGRMISVERAKADPSQVTIDKKPSQPDIDKGKGNEERNKPESLSKSTQQNSTTERSRDKRDVSAKSSNAERKPEKTANRSSRRRSKETESGDPSRDILTLDKIREERERERVRQWERTKRKEERRQQVMLQRERDRQREVERLQRDEADRLTREREKLRLEKQRLELDRLKAERERVALEREKQRRERERLEEEREQRRRELQRHERGTKRPADSSSYWPESKRAAPSPHSLRGHGMHHKSESTQRETSQYFDKKREERVKHGEKISSRRDIEIVVDHGKSSRKPSSPKLAWRPCSKLSISPTRHNSARDVGSYAGESQDWRSSANRSRTYESSSAYGQHWSDSRLGSSRTWSSNNAASNPSNLGTRGSFLASASLLMSSGRVHSDAQRYEGYKNISSSSSRRY